MKALIIAESIFASGLIDKDDDWDEMKIELESELDDLEIEGSERQHIIHTVKERWYA